MRNMEKVLSARTDMREKCLLWGLPGIVICIISLLVSLKVGYSFGQSSFVECITFAVCTALLFLLYWLIFQTLPQDLCNIIVSRWQKQTEQTNGISDIAEESRKQEKLPLPAVANIHSCPVQEDCGQTVEKPIEDSISVIQDATPLSESPLLIYDRCRSVHREQQERQRKEMLQCVNTYILETMSPFCDMETISFIQEDVMEWANDKNHEPRAVSVSSELTTLDLRHFVWNIAERLQFFGMDYSCMQRGMFVKRLFPDICRNAEADYLAKNLTHKAKEGFIKLDKPDKGEFLFHGPVE